MAKSGTISLTRSSLTDSNGYIIGKIEWSSTPNTTDNLSSVTARIYVRKDNTNGIAVTTATGGTWKFGITINGVESKGSVYKTGVKGSFVEIASFTTKVTHDSNGAKSITISGYVTGPSVSNYSGRTTEGEGVAVLDTIARASTISRVSNFILGNACQVEWTPAAASFRYTLNFQAGEWTHTVSKIHPNTTSGYGYSLDTSVYFEEICAASPKSATCKLKITLNTYSDAACTKLLGSATKEGTITIPEDGRTKPTIEMVLTPVNDFHGMYVAGFSRLQAKFTTGFKLGASQKSCTLQVDGVSYKATDNIAVSGGLLKSGTVKGVVTDTRGFTQSVPMDIEVKPYSDPSISSLECYRCDENGEERDNGTYLRIVGIRTYSYLDGQNACHVEYRIKDQNGEFPDAWTTIWEEDKSENAFAVIEDIQLNVGRAYVVEVRAVDKLKEPDGEQKIIPTQDVYWHRDGSLGSFTFGGYVEEKNTFAIHKDKTFKADGDAYFQGNRLADFVVEQGTSGVWTYRKWASGIAECSGFANVTVPEELTQSGSVYWSAPVYVDYPFAITDAHRFTTIANVGILCAQLTETHTDKLSFRVICTNTGKAGATVAVHMYVRGRWK